MLQRLPIALARVKASNKSQNLLHWNLSNNIFWIPSKRNYIKVYNNIMNSTKLQEKMDAIFMNPENSKTSDPRRLLLNLSNKINLKRREKYVASSNR